MVVSYRSSSVNRFLAGLVAALYVVAGRNQRSPPDPDG